MRIRKSSKSVENERSIHTREALIRAAIDVFGKYGLDGARSRMLADAAGVNAALINYHFGGKEGLYFAVFEHISHKISYQLSAVLQHIEAEFPKIVDPDEKRAFCIEQIEELLFNLLQTFVHEDALSWFPLLMQDHRSNKKAIEDAYSGVTERVLSMATRLVECAMGVDEGDSQARICTLMLVGQVNIFWTSYDMSLAYCQWQKIGDREKEVVRKQLRHNVQAILGKP